MTILNSGSINHCRNSADIWVVGGGRFGRKAVELLGARDKPDRILVVESDASAAQGLEELGAGVLNEDGLSFLLERLHETEAPKWILPCVPFHLAYQWVLGRLGIKARPIPVPPEYIKAAPNPMTADENGVYISYADFFCPPDCPEPADKCTHTGLPRKGSLFAEAATWPASGFRVEVVRSRQLAPGLGGILSTDLLDLKNRLEAPGKYLVVTACRCHGVVHGLVVE